MGTREAGPGSANRRGMSLFVRLAVVRSLREAARAAPPGFEVGGRLIVRGDQIVAFEQMPNLSREPGVYERDDRYPDDGRSWLAVHSHPRGPARPSRGDIEWPLWRGERDRAFAIYAAATGDLRVYQLTGHAKIRLGTVFGAPADERDYVEVPVSVERIRGSRPYARPGRR